EARQLQLSGVRHAFQRKPATLAPGGEFEQSGREYLARTVDRIERLLQQNEERRTELQRRVDLYGWLADRVGRTKQPDERTNSNRLIELLVSLDFSDGGVRVGPMAYGTLTRA